MKYLLNFWLIFSFFGLCTVMAQSPKGSNGKQRGQAGTIYITKSRPKVPSQVYHPPQSLYRNKMEVRLLLKHPANIPLMEAALPQGWANGHKGIVMALVEGLRDEKFVGVHPYNPQKSYLYRDLAFDLLTLEGQPVSQFSDADIFKIVEKSVQSALDIIADQGFSIETSREFFNIRFLRLVWFNPDKSKLPHILTLIPFQSVKKTLGGIMVKPHRYHHEATIRLYAFLETRRFYGRNLKNLNSPLYILHPYMREAALRESVLWKK